MPTVSWCLLSLAMSLLIGGCASSVVTENIGSCSPSYEIAQAGAGRLSIQQAGKGAAIQWGLYVEAPYKIGTQFVVTVYAGGVKIDGKNQNYEPHGRIGAAKALKYWGSSSRYPAPPPAAMTSSSSRPSAISRE